MIAALLLAVQCVVQSCPARPVAYGDAAQECLEDCRVEEKAAYWRMATVTAEPKMKLIVAPGRVCLAVPGQGCEFMFMVLIEKPGPDWYCPKVEFRWAEGRTSSEQSDCLPFEKVEEADRDWFRLSRWVKFGPGEWLVTAVVSQGTNKALLSRNVLVR